MITNSVEITDTSMMWTDQNNVLIQTVVPERLILYHLKIKNKSSHQPGHCWRESVADCDREDTGADAVICEQHHGDICDHTR